MKQLCTQTSAQSTSESEPKAESSRLPIQFERENLGGNSIGSWILDTVRAHTSAHLHSDRGIRQSGISLDRTVSGNCPPSSYQRRTRVDTTAQPGGKTSQASLSARPRACQASPTPANEGTGSTTAHRAGCCTWGAQLFLSGQHCWHRGGSFEKSKQAMPMCPTSRWMTALV